MQTRSSQSGFSLIELLISMTIFSVVVTMATGTLLVLLDANNKAQNMQAILNDLTIAIDSMTREVRTGYNYVCFGTGRRSVDSLNDTQDCAPPNVGNYLSVIEAGDSLTGGSGSQRVSYFYDSSEQAIFRRVGDGDGSGGTNEDSDWRQLTARNVRITTAEFIVTGTNAGLTDGQQPTVTIYLEGEAGVLAGVDSDFVLQTSVTQRPLDL